MRVRKFRSFPLALASAAATIIIASSASAQNTTEYQYDLLGRLIEVERRNQGCDRDATTAVTVDLMGNRTRSRTTKPSCTNSPPTTQPDSITVNYAEEKTISPLANDSDPDGDTLSITSFTQCGNEVCIVTRVSDTLLRIRGTDGPRTRTVNYTVTDGRGGTATGSIAVTVTGD